MKSNIYRSLDAEQTMKLVAQFHNKESQTIRNHAYKSSLKRADDLRISDASSKLAINLLALEQSARLSNVKPTRELERIWQIARSSIRFSYEAIKNLQLRGEYLSKVGKIYYCEMGYRNSLKHESEYFSMKQQQQMLDDIRALSPKASRIASDPGAEKLNVGSPRRAFSEEALSWEELDRDIWKTDQQFTKNVLEKNFEGIEPIKAAEDPVPLSESFVEAMENEATGYMEQLNKLYEEWGSRISSSWRRAVSPVTPKQFRANLVRGVAQETNVPRLFKNALDTKAIAEEELQYYATVEQQLAGAEKAFQSLIKSREQTLFQVRTAGAALLILTAGIMVWNIAQSEHPGMETAKAAWTIGPALVGGYIGTEATAWLLTAFEAEAMLFIGGLLGGFIGAFAAGLAAESLFEALVALFSYHPNPRLTAAICSQPLRSELALPNHIELSREFVSRLT